MLRCKWCFDEIRPGEKKFHGNGRCCTNCPTCDELNLRVCTHALNNEREGCDPSMQQLHDELMEEMLPFPSRRFRTLNEARMQAEFYKASKNGIDVERTDTGGVRITHAYRERMKKDGVWTFGEVKQTM